MVAPDVFIDPAVPSRHNVAAKISAFASEKHYLNLSISFVDGALLWSFYQQLMATGVTQEVILLDEQLENIMDVLAELLHSAAVNFAGHTSLSADIHV